MYLRSAIAPEAMPIERGSALIDCHEAGRAVISTMFPAESLRMILPSRLTPFRG